MTSIDADTIAATDALTIESNGRQAAAFLHDGVASLVLGDSAADAYEIEAPYIPPGVADRTDMFDSSISFNPADTNLGRADGYDSEPFWEIGGGALHIRGTNHSTGGSVSYIFRIGAYDELELVKKIEPVFGDVTYETVSKFGFKRQNERGVMSDRGIISFGSVGPVATVTTFMPFDEYTLVVGVADQPVTSQTLIQNAANCFVVPDVPPGSDVTHTVEVVKHIDGQALTPGETYWLNAIVRENAPGGLTSSEPRTTAFVL